MACGNLDKTPVWSWPVYSVSFLSSALRKVHLKTPDGSKIMFDDNGDLITKFEIFQGQKTLEGVFHLVHVGMIDPQKK